MKRAWLFVIVVFVATPAAAQQYQYVARTEAPVARQGAVTAGILTWQCQGSACSIAGPWPIPSPEACAQLAREIGRISAYGREGRMLDAAGLATCNAGLAPASPPVAPQVVRPGVRLPDNAVLRTSTNAITTPELSFVGGGAAPTVASVRTPITSPELSFIGGGAAPVGSSITTPIITPELSFVGG